MLKTALRVLTAANERHDPDPADLEELRRYAPHRANAPIDELACEVIQQALKVRKEMRKS